jgi:hypothetical protein
MYNFSVPRPTLILSLLAYITPTLVCAQVPLTVAQIAKKVSPSVVIIQGTTDSGDVLGSGFIIAQDGKIVTNLHVIRELKTATVQLANGQVYDSLSVLATDERRDLAIVRVSGFNLPFLNLGNSDSVTVGEPMVIVGSPRGLEGTVTAGILSSIRDLGDGSTVLQTDASVNPGNSGGPLVNNKGQAVGVVSFQLNSAQGLNFAIPINYVRTLLRNVHKPISLATLHETLNLFPGVNTSLIDTLYWLKQTLPAAKTEYVETMEGWYAMWTTSTIVLNLDSCTMQLETRNLSTFAPEPDKGFQIHGTDRFTVPLGLVSKAAIEREQNSSNLIRGDAFTHRLTLTTRSKLVHLVKSVKFPTGASRKINGETIPVKDIYEDKYTDTFRLDFNDASTAEQVKVGLLHASDLCQQAEPPASTRR